MDVRLHKQDLLELIELKDNLRLDRSFEMYDQDLRFKLQAAIRHAEAFIGRDLGQTPVISYPFVSDAPVALDNALHVSSVKINGTLLEPDSWFYADGVLKIDGTHAATDEVEVETVYNADIKIAVLMHASSMWLNPADSVETLPKASTNLLSQYRHYECRH